MKSSIDKNWMKKRKFWRREIEKFGWQNSDTTAAVHWISAKRVGCFPYGLGTNIQWQISNSWNAGGRKDRTTQLRKREKVIFPIIWGLIIPIPEISSTAEKE